MKKRNFTLLTNKDLENIFIDNNIPKFRAKQVTQPIYEKFISSFDHINNIPKDLKEILNDNFTLNLPKIVEKSPSPDNTTKYLLELEDKNYIECVYLPYKDRKSICVSTQVGCPIGCKFCASGVNGFVRNLSVYEIIGQLLTVQNDVKEKITHIVYMGIGEPLLNLQNVIKSIRLINTNFNISQRRITVSTSGITAKIYELAKADLDITLALSLHSPFQEEREELIPSASHNILPKLLTACDEYFNLTKRRITFEYILIGDINSSENHARELSKIAREHKAHINLIPCNPTDHFPHSAPSEKQIKRFTDILTNNGVNFSLREKKGNTTNSACGQLRNRKLN